ncbi:MAG: AAA family ATPase [Selenomonadaceae bacterium]|nr:AAA family ATPase [Selenomonadaceae bacterium]
MHLIKIHKFGPITDCVMDIKKFTVLTGPQAEGKSTIAKAIYYFLCVKDIFREQILKNKTENPLPLENVINFLRTKFFATFGGGVVNSKEMRLEYFYKLDTWIVITASEKISGRFFLDFQFSENFNLLLEKNFHKDLLFWESEENRDELQKILKSFFDIDFKPIYIPAGRSTIASLTDYISEIFIRNDSTENRMIEQNIGACVRDYVLLILILRRTFFSTEPNHLFDDVINDRSTADKNLINYFLELVQKILKGKYFFKNGEEFLITEENSSVQTKMSFASSGQQEIVWVCNIMFFYLFQKIPVFLILEEPEAHLYPDSQKNISNLISLFVHAENNVLITTHSPYILGTLSNLLDAQRMKNEGYDISNLLKKENLISAQLLERDNFSAYFVDGGNLYNAVDEENGLIKNEMIDDASDKINGFADDLMYLEREGKNNVGQ